MRGRRRLTGDSRIATLAAALGIMVGFTVAARDALAYTDIGDRVFVSPAEIPPIAPGDEFYFWGTSQPMTGGGDVSNFNFRLMKSITDRLGVEAVETYTRIGVPGGPPHFGWANLDTTLKYLAIEDQPDEFLLSIGLIANGAEPGRSASALIAPAQRRRRSCSARASGMSTRRICVRSRSRALSETRSPITRLAPIRSPPA